MLFKIPDMNTPLSGGFTHVVDTLVGAAIAMLINTRTAPDTGASTTTSTTTTTTPSTKPKTDEPTPVVIQQPATQPVPVKEAQTESKP